MSEIRIRRAGAGDAPELARLRHRFKVEDGERGAPDPERFLADCRAWLRDRLAGGRWLAWVADEDGRLRGHVFVNRVEKVPSPFPGSTELGYVTNFYVEPACRGRGLGRALLAAVDDHARAHRFDTLVVWPSERSAALYRRAGYAAPAELLELPVGPFQDPPAT
jgi:GNAT superfamily N-acetyltransferase